MFEGCHTVLSSLFFEKVLFFVFLIFFQIREVIEEEAEEVVVVGALYRDRLHCVTAGSKRKGGEVRRQEEQSRGTARREGGVSSLT